MEDSEWIRVVMNGISQLLEQVAGRTWRWKGEEWRQVELFMRTLPLLKVFCMFQVAIITVLLPGAYLFT